MTGSAATRAEARAAIIDQLFAFRRETGLGRIESRDAFVEQYNAGQFADLAVAQTIVPTLNARSLRRWETAVRERGTDGLKGRYGNRKGSSVIDGDGELKEFILGMLRHAPHADCVKIIAALRTEFDRERLPSYRAVQRWVANWKNDNKALFALMRSPDEWKGKHMASFGDAAEGIKRLNQVWELDSTPADVMLKDGRYSVIGVLDVYSRRFLLHVSKTSNSKAIAAAMRRAIVAWGVPEIVKTDQGKDYVSRHVTRVLSDLRIDPERCQPFSPWKKPFVERHFRTWAHDLLPLLPEYIGHNVTERQAIRDRTSFADRLMKKNRPVSLAMSAADLQKFCDDWSAAYEQQPHSGLAGASPKVRAASYEGHVATIPDERALDVLLAPAPGSDGIRQVGKKGVKVDGMTYIAAELGPLIGQRVQVLYDETDLGRVFIRDAADFEFICVAVSPEHLGFSRKEIAQEATRLQRRHVSQARRDLNASAKRFADGTIADRIMQNRFEATSSVTAFPRPSTDHSTPQLEAAGDVVSFDDTGPAGDLDEAALAAAQDQLSRLEEPPLAPELRVVSTDGRPTFDDDATWAEWVIENTDKATDGDKKRLIERLESLNFRLLLGLDEDEARKIAAGL